MTSPEDLRGAPLPQQRVGGYARDVVDDLLGRAAQTVETLLNEVNASQKEIARLESAQAALEGRLVNAARRSPEEIVGDVLMTAQQAAETLLEKANEEAAAITAAARRELTPILAEARATLERASGLHQEAHAAVEQAHLQASAILDAARAEQDQLVAEAVSLAARRRDELELSNQKLEIAIKGLRNEWAGRAAEALARLDGIGLESSRTEDASLADRGLHSVGSPPTATDLPSGAPEETLSSDGDLFDILSDGQEGSFGVSEPLAGLEPAGVAGESEPPDSGQASRPVYDLFPIRPEPDPDAAGPGRTY